MIPEPVAEKCRGYNPLIDIHTELNPTSLKDLNLAVDYKTLHHVSCAGNSYQLSPGCSTANKACSDLAFSPSLIKAIEKGKEHYDKNMNSKHAYLSHKQLSEKARQLQVEKRNLRLELMNSKFKCSKLCATLSMYQRFLVSIAENNLPRLQQLVQIALKNNRSIGYIVSKVTDVIDGIYMANPSQDDKDLAFLVLKFGGPSLLNILHRAGTLPSVSLAYNISKNCPPITSSVQSSVADCFESNICISDTGNCLVSLKMDETPMLSYNQKDNQCYGSCFQHGKETKLQLDCFCEVMPCASKPALVLTAHAGVSAV